MERLVIYQFKWNTGRAYWAIRTFNSDITQEGKQRLLQLNELDELWRESYESSRIDKERLKLFHDKTIARKTFEPNQKVLLYSSRLHLFPGKLRSRWTSPFIVKVVYPYGAVEIENPDTENPSKSMVNASSHSSSISIFKRLVRTW